MTNKVLTFAKDVSVGARWGAAIVESVKVNADNVTLTARWDAVKVTSVHAPDHVLLVRP